MKISRGQHSHASPTECDEAGAQYYKLKAYRTFVLDPHPNSTMVIFDQTTKFDQESPDFLVLARRCRFECNPKDANASRYSKIPFQSTSAAPRQVKAPSVDRGSKGMTVRLTYFICNGVLVS